jgi:RNA polymerase sigma-70 factor (ECF subfamily)
VESGTEPDLDQVYASYVGPVRSYLYHLTGDWESAEDLVHEAFYRAMRQFLMGARVRHVSAWLYRIARNLYLDRVKRRGPEEMSLDALDDRTVHELFERARDMGGAPGTPVGQPEVELDRRETSAGIATALRALPERQRTALILRDAEGLSYQELAEVLRTSVGAVKSLLHRARNRFIEIYGREGEDEEGDRESEDAEGEDGEDEDS